MMLKIISPYYFCRTSRNQTHTAGVLFLLKYLKIFLTPWACSLEYCVIADVVTFLGRLLFLWWPTVNITASVAWSHMPYLHWTDLVDSIVYCLGEKSIVVKSNTETIPDCTVPEALLMENILLHFSLRNTHLQNIHLLLIQLDPGLILQDFLTHSSIDSTQSGLSRGAEIKEITSWDPNQQRFSHNEEKKPWLYCT